MAYRRRQAVTRAATFQEDLRPRIPLHEDDEDDDPLPPKDGHRRAHSYSAASSSPSLAAEAIRASNVRRDSPLSSGYSTASSFNSSKNDASKEAYDRGNSNEVEGSSTFWGVLAKKAKALVDDEPFQDPDLIYTNRPTNSQYYYQPYQQPNSRKEENPALRKSLDKIASSLNHIGGQIGNAFEEGRTMVENRTADIMQETRKLQIRRQENNNFNDQNYKLQIRRPENNNFDDQNYPSGMHSPWKSFNKSSQHVMYSHEDRLKASRDVALATAAKAKVLLRELKTVKADLAFAKERCSQLEDENKLLRDTCEKGGNRADDDMIRLQLETLLAEKSRLANENSVYARENRFLMEIVEYHQLTMQDVVYLDEGIEEVTEVYPIPGVSRMLSTSPPSPSSPRSSLSHDEITLSRSSSHHKSNESLSRSGSAKKLSSHIELNDSQEYQQNSSLQKKNKSLSRSGSAKKLSSHIELNDSQEYQQNSSLQKKNKSLSRSGSAKKLSSHIELNDSQEHQHN